MPYLRHPGLAGALLLAMATAALPVPAQGQVRRCTTPDGGTVYTDRTCASVGGVSSRPMADGGRRAPLRYRGGCARNLQDLVSEVSSAIDARDGNRLARSYHWVGMGHRSGYAMADRLDAIARRPLLNITALRPAQAVVVPTRPSNPYVPATAAAIPREGTGAATVAGTSASAPPSPRRPVALRIDQVLDDGISPSTTTFGLRRHMDCWWISL